MSKRIVAQAARVIALIGALAAGGCTSNPAWTAGHTLTSGDQIVPTLADGLPGPAGVEIEVPQTP